MVTLSNNMKDKLGIKEERAFLLMGVCQNLINQAITNDPPMINLDIIMAIQDYSKQYKFKNIESIFVSFQVAMILADMAHVSLMPKLDVGVKPTNTPAPQEVDKSYQ